MGAPTNTTQTYGVGTAGGLREDLEDVIWDLFADENQVQTRLDRGVEATATYHEWLLDNLAAAAANSWAEGDDHTASSLVAPTRVGNHLQILRKDFTVSGTLEEVKKAGRRSEIARAAMKKMRELKNDLEYTIVRNQANTAPAGATARSFAGMESWISTNEILGTTTAGATTPGFISGVVAAPTDGTTTGAFTEGHLKSAVVGSWSAGGDASMILLGSTQKNAADAFAGIATRYRNVEGNRQASIISAADVFVSDVGSHKLILHRHVRASVVLCIDPEYWALAFLRRPRMETLAKTGDAEKRMILMETTLVSRNEKASAKVVALA